MKTLNSPWLTLILLGSFCVLASYSYGKYGPVGHATHTSITWNNKAAKQIADIYNLTIADVSKPIDLFSTSEPVKLWRKK